MRTLLASPDPRAREAIDLFVSHTVREIGALAATLGGLDGLVFTGGIGENAAEIRHLVSARLAWMGLSLDGAANASHQPLISMPTSRIVVRVLPTDEELVIARQTISLLG
jgi:acetate kinase